MSASAVTAKTVLQCPQCTQFTLRPILAAEISRPVIWICSSPACGATVLDEALVPETRRPVKPPTVRVAGRRRRGVRRER